MIDIEEITHKAGNFKKFSLFTKMLYSAFSKTNDSVFIDLLTLADLEMLKARKAGSQSASVSTSQGRPSHFIAFTANNFFTSINCSFQIDK
jgi:coiled-coil domain-containing protein 61